MSTHCFKDLRTVIDDVHALFDEWDDSGRFRPPLDCDGEIVLRLAVHEWIANLVQHATFSHSAPEIHLELRNENDAVVVSIEDTSKGFDLLGQLEEQHQILGAPAPSERGRGLLMLITCTEELEYSPADGDRQRLSFHLRNPGSSVFAGLFQSSSLVDPASPTEALGDLIDPHHAGDGAAQLSSPPRPSSR